MSCPACSAPSFVLNKSQSVQTLRHCQTPCLGWQWTPGPKLSFLYLCILCLLFLQFLVSTPAERGSKDPVGLDPTVGSSRPARPTRRNPVSTTNTKLAQHGGSCLYPQLLERLRQKPCLNLGGRGCSELRSCHCTQAWATRAKLHLKKKEKKKRKRKQGS